MFFIFAQIYSSTTAQHTDEARRGHEKVARFHPLLMTNYQTTTQEDRLCLEDIRHVQHGVRNHSLWAGISKFTNPLIIRRIFVYGSHKHVLVPIPLVRESMAYPCMDFQKSTDMNMDIHDFRMTVFNYP